METIIASIISGVFGLFAGFFTGKTYAINRNIKQNQKAGDNSSQKQIGVINEKCK